MSTNLEWVTDANRAFILSRRFACQHHPEGLADDMRELSKRYHHLATECAAHAADAAVETTTLHIIDQALRESQQGYNDYKMAMAVFDALGIDPAPLNLLGTVRRIITRNLMDTNFVKMAEEVTAAIEKKKD